jgi:hypothetical protein
MSDRKANENAKAIVNIFKGRAIIAAIIITAAAVCIIYLIYLNMGYDNKLSAKQEEYDLLSQKFIGLSNDYNASLDENKRISSDYEALNKKFNNLSVNNSELQGEIELIRDKLGSFLENPNGVAFWYFISNENISGMPKKVVYVTVYNVGKERLNRTVVKCGYVENSSGSMQEQTFHGMEPLTKANVRWEFGNSTDIKDVWVEKY